MLEHMYTHKNEIDYTPIYPIILTETFFQNKTSVTGFIHQFMSITYFEHHDNTFLLAGHSKVHWVSPPTIHRYYSIRKCSPFILNFSIWKHADVGQCSDLYVHMHVIKL
jgi:hypothetical protein